MCNFALLFPRKMWENQGGFPRKMWEHLRGFPRKMCKKELKLWKEQVLRNWLNGSNAITSLKYFYENAPGYHVVAAGSLLGIELHKGESFPVGKVQFLTLYPMSFVEFVMAMGENGLAQFLQNKDWDMINAFAPKYQELIRYYYYVGGMPEAVLSFSQNRDWK